MRAQLAAAGMALGLAGLCLAAPGFGPGPDGPSFGVGCSPWPAMMLMTLGGCDGPGGTGNPVGPVNPGSGQGPGGLGSAPATAQSLLAGLAATVAHAAADQAHEARDRAALAAEGAHRLGEAGLATPGRAAEAAERAASRARVAVELPPPPALDARPPAVSLPQVEAPRLPAAAEDGPGPPSDEPPGAWSRVLARDAPGRPGSADDGPVAAPGAARDAPLAAHPGHAPSYSAAGAGRWVPALLGAAAPPAAWAAAALALVGSLLLAPAVALYHRVRERRLLENPTRRALRAHVVAHPGTTTAEAARAAGCNFTTAKRHLGLLVAFGHLAAMPAPRGLRFFENHGRIPREARPRLALLRAPANRAFVEAVRARPGAPLREVARALGIAKSTASRRAALLRGAGLLAGDGRALRPAEPAPDPHLEA